MSWNPDRYRELRSRLRPERLGDDVAEEIEHHLSLLTEDYIRRGMAPEAARRAALERFGDVERYRAAAQAIDESHLRERRRMEHLDAIRRELRHALRGLARSRSFTVVTVLTLALGIGAVTAIFAVLYSVVLSPLPYPEAGRLVYIDSRVPSQGPDATWGLSAAGYFHFRENSRAFEHIGVYAGAFSSDVRFNLTDDRGARRVPGMAVSASLFDALGARAVVGRLFTAEEDRPGAPDVVVLGHDLWQREYGGDPAVVGSTIELNLEPRQVVGVAAPGFHLPDRRVDVWVPLQLNPAAQPVNAHYLAAVGRLRPGVAAADAEQDLARLTAQFTELFPTAYDETFVRETGFSTQVRPLRDVVIGDVTQTLWILLAAVGLVLVIACVNVGNLFLLRAEARRRELAVRRALGAEGGHLAWQHLTESLMLVLLAGALALGLAYAGVRLVLALAPAVLPRLDEIHLGGSAVAFTAAVCLVLGIVFGLVPLTHGRDFGALREGGRGLTGGRLPVRRTLVAGQVALALVLLAAAGVMLRSFQNLRDVDPGLEPDRALTVQVAIPFQRYRDFDATNAFYRELLQRLEALPGVVGAGATTDLPLDGETGCSSVWVENGSPGPGEEPPCVRTTLAAPGYFAALGIETRGRAFTWADNERRADGVLVTRALAERFWPGQDPIGKGIRPNGGGPPYWRVIGVTEDIRDEGLDRPPLEAVFFPLVPAPDRPLWSPPRALTLVIRTATDRPDQLAPAVRELVQELDPTVPLGRVRTMEQVIAAHGSVARRTFAMLLLGIAGAMALVLSVVGLYGVVSYVVGQRRAEIGVRIALGARAAQVQRMVLADALWLAAIGVALGIAGALVTTRLLRALLFEISPTDPLTLGAAAALLLVVGLLASLNPARRAARVDPMQALRAE